MLIADNSHRFSPIHQEFQGIFKGDCTDWHPVRMSCLNFTPILYHGGTCIGQVNIYLQYEDYNVMNVIDKGVRITHFSSSSNRCPPLVVLHTIASSGVSFKMEQHPQTDLSALNHIYSTCLKEAKTAIISVGVMELHLVAMKSLNGQNKVPCFWGFLVSSALYNSCLQMLNIRCLAIVFDLDETLLVANTMRSFEDRIDALHRKIASEIDTHRVSGMLAEIKQYQEDKTILKQYAENDEIIDNGKLIKVQYEAVPPLTDNQCTIERPLIRLQERNMILTRIHPNIRDTSVLVRLRPAWEYFKNFLTVKGRKRFEVFVCTMAERDYALEMWRLLDPEACLINSMELPHRVLCVKSDEEASMSNIHIGRLGAHNVSNAVDLLKKISMKCGQKVEFRHGLNDTTDLQFHTEVLFGEEKVGKGIGGTRKEAQLKAAEDALRCMASQYVASPGSVEDGLVRGWHEEGFRETCSSESVGDPQEVDALSAATPGHSNHGDQWLSEDFKRPYNSVDTLKHLCTMGGLSLVFQDQTEIGAAKRKCCAYIHSCAQEGRILGEGSSLTWKAAKLQAAEEGLRNLESEISQPHQKELDSPRYPMVQPNKRIKYTRYPRSGAVKS